VNVRHILLGGKGTGWVKAFWPLSKGGTEGDGHWFEFDELKLEELRGLTRELRVDGEGGDLPSADSMWSESGVEGDDEDEDEEEEDEDDYEEEGDEEVQQGLRDEDGRVSQTKVKWFVN
jgi:hypothetical protein